MCLRCVADRMSKTTTFFIFHFLQNTKILQENHVLIVGIGVSTSPLKNTPLFLAKPPLNQQTVQAPLFRQLPYILVFHDPPPPAEREVPTMVHLLFHWFSGESLYYIYISFTQRRTDFDRLKKRNMNDRTIILLTSLLITLT